VKILIFEEQIYPSENLEGLKIAASASNTETNFVFIGKTEKGTNLNNKFFNSNDHINVIKELLTADIAIAIPSKYFFLRILSAMKFLKFKSVFLGPGKVTKAIGSFKHPERGGFPKIKTFFKFYLLNTYYIANDEQDKSYCSEALGYPLNRILIKTLPKYLYINKKLCEGNKHKDSVGILFAPTHRWLDVIPPLTQMLSKDNFVEKIKKMNAKILHSKHPETKFLKLNSRVSNFSSNWNDVDILITDYSSIGDDYINSGGKKLIYYIEDKNIFEINQGVGKFFDESLEKGVCCKNETELIHQIRKHLNNTSNILIEPINTTCYFETLFPLNKNTV
jgi:hypothetical protein